MLPVSVVPRHEQRGKRGPSTGRWLSTLFGVALLIGIAACDADPLDRPVLPETQTERDRPEVEALCTETIPSTGILMLTWRYHDQSDDGRRIDLTVYKDGFDQDRYASLWPLKIGQQSQKLKISNLRSHPADPALLPRLTSLSRDPQRGSTTMRLEGLAGGLVYGIRLATLKHDGWVPGPSVRVQAPACITEPFGNTEKPNPGGD